MHPRVAEADRVFFGSGAFAFLGLFPGFGGRAERGRIRSPNSRAIAGTSVSAISTATVTAAAAARPITVSTGMFATESPASAITTVAPANTTALPAVARARDIDSVATVPRRDGVGSGTG